MARGAPSRPLQRRVGGRRPRKTVLVCCEGRRTEPEYFLALKSQPQVRDVAAVEVIPGRGGSATDLIKRAIAD